MISLNNLLKSLEDAGEVGVQLAEHQLTKDSAGNFTVKALTNVCFVLDEPKDKKKKKKNGKALARIKLYIIIFELFQKTPYIHWN